MFNLEAIIDLPFAWYVLIAAAVFLYVVLDGFDLGLGILFPLAPTDGCRDRMMASIAPFWDGNETWLVLGGGGLFAAFPLAYAVLMPAFYLPVTAMLLGLIFRGVSFEFRHKARGASRRIWDAAFCLGSILAAFCQGTILGGLVQGVQVDGRSYGGGAFDWLGPFSFMTGVALICGYALLGATWLIMKTEDVTQEWARRCTRYLLAAVAVFMALVSLTTPLMHGHIKTFWFAWPNFLLLSPLPVLSILFLILLWRDLSAGREYRPFLLSLGLFMMNYIGLGLSLWPWLVPFEITFRQAAAAPESQSLLLVGTVVLLPIVLAYMGYSYYVFRGKSTADTMY